MQPPQDVQPARSGPSPPKYGSGTVTPGSPKKTATSVGCHLSTRPRSRPTSRRISSGGDVNGTRAVPSIRFAVA